MNYCFSSDGILCPKCDTEHNPNDLECSEFDPFQEGYNQIECPKCKSKIGVQTNIITEWGVEIVD